MKLRSIQDIDAILQERLAYKNKWGNPCPGSPGALKLKEGDNVGPYGWTAHEIEAAPDTRGQPREARLTQLAEFWLGKWRQEHLDEMAKSAAEARAQAEAKAKRRWAEHGPPGFYSRLDFNSFLRDTPERDDAFEKVVNFPWSAAEDDLTQFSTLALLGTPGTGKTHLAALWLRQQIFSEGYAGQFINAKQLVREIRRAWNDRGVDETAQIERFGSAEALVIDDVGVDTSDGAIGILVEVLDQRLANEVPTCFTSNATPAELKDIFGPRGFSRLMASAQTVVLVGTDMRRAPDLQVKADH